MVIHPLFLFYGPFLIYTTLVFQYRKGGKKKFKRYKKEIDPFLLFLFYMLRK